MDAIPDLTKLSASPGLRRSKKYALYCLVTLVNVPVETWHSSSHALTELIGHVHIGHA